MKPAPFEYHAPASLDETLALLDDLRDDDAKILAGGQSLMPILNMRLARPSHVVDINGLRDLAYLTPTEDGGLAVGALTRHRTLEYSPEVARAVPLLAEAIPLVGDRQIRYRGTAGGSLVHADPAAELPTIVGALDAELVVASREGRRVVPANEFFLTFLTTVLEPQELLVEIRFPPPPPRAGHAFLELARQHGDFAIVSAAVCLALENNHIAAARICVGGAGPTPIRATDAEEALHGAAPTPEAFAEAGRLAAAATDPSGDVHGSAEYRREMAGVFVRRALTTAHQRATTQDQR
jgi:CO/xanthine dehydrogenase FAD-binding subunit